MWQNCHVFNTGIAADSVAETELEATEAILKTSTRQGVVDGV